MFDGLSLDLFTPADDGFGAPEVGIGGRHVVQALVVALVIVVLDERRDPGVEVAGPEVLFRFSSRMRLLRVWCQRSILALRMGMERSAADIAHVLRLDVIGQFRRNVARPIVAEQPGSVVHMGLAAA